MNANERGFTLIECLVAMVVLTIGIFALYAMQVSAMRGNHVADLITQSSTLSILQIEKMLAGNYGKLNKNNGALVDTNGNGKVRLVNDVTPVPNASNRFFGLDDGKELKADVGLAACRQKADHCEITNDGRYLVFWNVADDYPSVGVKTIRVHVRNRANPNMNPVTYEMIRNNPTLNI